MEVNPSACVLVLDLPPAAFCGIDLLSFTTNPRFKGIKHVPKGWHFLFTGANSAFSLRQGVWFHVPDQKDGPPSVQNFRWNARNEELVVEKDAAIAMKLRANLGSIWRECLTPYRQSIPDRTADGEAAEETNDWPTLTSYVSETLLSRIMEHSGNEHYWSISSASSAKQDADIIPGLTSQEVVGLMDQELNFLPINLKKTWREGAVGRERTEAAQDRSWALENLMREHCNHPLDIIGELQAVFIMVLTLNNNSCLEQWKRILGLVLTCKTAAVKQASFFTQFLSTLRLQLEHCSDAEGGLFDLSDEGATLLKSLLKRFREGLEQQLGSQGKLDVMDALDELEDFLKLEHGWLLSDAHVRRGRFELEDGESIEVGLIGVDYDDEEGDYAPAIADVDPDLTEQWRLQSRRHLSGLKGQSMVETSEGSDDDEDEGIEKMNDPNEEDSRSLEEMDDRY